MATYVSALHCAKCDNYFKGHRDPEPCPECGGKSKWEMVLKYSEKDPQQKKVFTNLAFKENIRVSRSLGVPLSQLKEAQERHPGVEFKKVGNSACPVIHNRTEKLKVMKQAGMVEYPPNLFKQIDEKSKWENRKRRQ
jgi:hypothetical protein